VHELDRILDRDHVIRPGGVDQIEHRGLGGRLARAGGPGDQHQSLGQRGEVHDRLRESQLLGGEDFRRNDAKDAADTLPVAEQIAAEARESLDGVAEVGVEALGELVLLRLGRDLEQDSLEGIGIENRDIVHIHEKAVDPQHRLALGAHVQVRGALLDHLVEQSVHVQQ